jgi:hypothetical protein
MDCEVVLTGGFCNHAMCAGCRQATQHRLWPEFRVDFVHVSNLAVFTVW